MQGYGKSYISGTIRAFGWRDEGKPPNTSIGIVLGGLNFKTLFPVQKKRNCSLV
jgi:hypothetical protein